VRRAEIVNRQDEQKLQQHSEIADVTHQLEINRARFEEDFRQNQERIARALRQRLE
jgi:hypothetical protein